MPGSKHLLTPYSYWDKIYNHGNDNKINRGFKNQHPEKAFSSEKIINQQISTANLHAFFVGYDVGLYRNEPFTEILSVNIVDFAIGYLNGRNKTIGK